MTCSKGQIKFIVVFLIIPLVYSQAQPRLPSGLPGPGLFGAYYEHLKFTPEWDKPWRVGDHSDVVIRFDDGGHRFVFWRGTSYIPCWVTDTGVWYTNEFVERRGHHSPNTEGCVEPMSDKQCRFSHVRIIENHPARVVVHWRYAPVDVKYEHPFTDPETGWSDWVDEYYTIYPDAVGVRKITVHTTRPDLWTEFQEAIVINQPGTLPDENIEKGAVSVANIRGEHKTYYWTEEGGPEFDDLPKQASIVKVNLKGSKQTFSMVVPPEEEGDLITPYMGHGRNSYFNWWDHWPVSQDASDGRGATSAAKPSHSSLCHIGLPGMADVEWKPYAAGKEWVTKLMLHGMTDKTVEDLVPLAKSWLFAPKVEINDKEWKSDGYDKTQMAFVFTCQPELEAQPISMTIKANMASPLVNPAFILRGWGTQKAVVKLNGMDLRVGKDYRLGYQHNLEGSDLIVWVPFHSKKIVKLSIQPEHEG